MISIFDKNYNRIAFLSNDSPNGIHYFDDQLTTEIDTGVYTFEFKVPKTSTRHRDFVLGNFIHLTTPQGKDLLLVHTQTTENRDTITIYCEDTTIQNLNMYVDAIEEPTTAQSIDYYLNHTLKDSNLEVKNNEATGVEKLSFGSSQRLIERLQKLAVAFDVEIDFDVDFDGTKPPKRYVSFLNQRNETNELAFRITSDDLLGSMERDLNTFNIATRLLVRGRQKEAVQAPTQLDQKASAPVAQTPQPTVDAKAEKAIQWAKDTAKRRLPYVWGGNGPNGYDCSGYVTAAWRAAGVTIPGRPTTYTMWAQQSPFKRISKSELKPGDLIMYDTGYTSSIPNHVGMYLGGGLSAPNSVIHAGNPVGIRQRADSMSIIGYVRVQH